MASRSTFRLRPHLLHLLRAGSVAFASLYAGALIYAEQQYVWAFQFAPTPAVAISTLQHVKQAFPFDHRFRTGVAEYYSRVRWKGSRPGALAALDEAIKADPYGMDLHRNRAGFLYEKGDLAGVDRELLFMQRYMPGRQTTIVVNMNPATN